MRAKQYNKRRNIFQRRTVYDVSFHDKTFEEYENGFGDMNDARGGDLWLGLKTMSQLTSAGKWKLRVEFSDFVGNVYWVEYSG